MSSSSAPPVTSSSFIQSTPSQVVFPSCTISTSYSTTIILSSMLTSSSKVTISCSSTSKRDYTITPGPEVTIPAFKRKPIPSAPSELPQGVPVTIKLRISSLSSSDVRQGNSPEGIRDYVTVKGDYFEQRIPVVISLKQPPSSPSRASVPVSSADSATVAMVEQLQKRVEQLSSQNSSLQQTLTKQTSENDHLRSLLDAVEADRSRTRQLIDDEIKRERESFEGRSAKVLIILKRRDDTIDKLNSLVEELSERNVQDRSTADTVRDRLQGEIDRLQERVISLSKESRRTQLESLDSIRGDVSDLRVNDSVVEEEYRRKIDQQDEQIEVLMSEVNALRSSTSRSVHDSSESSKSLKRENHALKKNIHALTEEKSVLEKAFENQRIVMDNLKTSYQAKTNAGAYPQPSLTEFDQTSKICDLEVKNSQLSSLLTEKIKVAEQQSKKANQLETLLASSKQENQGSSKKLQNLSPILKQTEIKYKKAQDHIVDLKTKVTRLEELNRTARDTCTMTDARLQEALVQIDDMASDQPKGRKRPSHRAGVMAWWTHIANEARTKRINSHSHEHQNQSVAEQNLVAQGVVISKLRQDLLKSEVVNRQTIDDMEEKLKASAVRIATLEQSIRIRRDDGHTRLRELEAALRVVSGRSDLHSSLAAARQELASERVKEVHQRGELELQVNLLEEERARTKELRSKIDQMQDEVDLCRTLKTLEGIPGVDPLAIIDEFAGAAAKQDEVIAMLEKDVKKYRKRRKHGGDGGGSDPDSDYSEDSDSDSDKHVNNNVNNPNSIEAVEVERLATINKDLEAQVSKYENALISEKQQSLKKVHDAEQLLSETMEQNRRVVAKLERKLTTSQSQGNTMKKELEKLRGSQLEVDDHVRMLNFELEKVKGQLSLQLKANAVGDVPGSEAKPAVSSEITRLQSLLDERTSNCAVLMQTVESLQQSLGVVSLNEDGSIADASLDGDSLMDSSVITNKPNAFAHHTLAKRVIALTAELSSDNTVAAMMERRAEQMALEIKQRNDLVSYLEDKLNLYEEENQKHEARASVVATEHSRMMTTFNREVSKIENENSNLRRSLHECEIKVRDGDVEVSALSADIVVLEEIVYNLRLKMKSLKDGEGPDAPSAASSQSNEGADFQDQTRVMSVVEGFIDQLQQMRSATSTRRSKSQDDQIFAWITDVIVKTDVQNIASASRARHYQIELRKALVERDVSEMNLEEIKGDLSRTKKRLTLVEGAMEERTKLNLEQTEASFALSDSRMTAMHAELVTLAEKDLYICAEHRSVTQQLEKTKKELRTVRQQKSIVTSELKQATNKARIKANNELDEKIEACEIKQKQWVEAELPALISGRAAHGKSWNEYDKYDDELNNATDTNASLAQALSSSKAVQHVLETKLEVALERMDAANAQSEEAATTANNERGMARLWELYAPTGIIQSTVSASAHLGEPNPTFQNLITEVDSLRASVKYAQEALEVSEKEQRRLAAWLEEARKDAGNAQEQLNKRTNAIRNELEKRHNKEISAMQKHNSEQHSAQVHALGRLRSELLNKETALQEAKLRLQLFGDNGNNMVEEKLNSGEISFHPPIVQANALQQERDFLLQQNDSLVEELKVCSQEKFDLENENERLVGAAASVQAETSHLAEELSIHRSALRALEESVSAAVTESASEVQESSGKSMSASVMSRSLASAKLAEASALQRLQKSAQNEVRLRAKIEECERTIKELKRLSRGQGRGDGKVFRAEAEKAYDKMEEEASPWLTESVGKLRQRVSTQASAIAYLELRIAQLMGDLSTEAGNNVVQNLQRELRDVKEQKLKVERELEEQVKNMEARGKFALSVLDENTTRIEGEREIDRLRDLDARRETELGKMETQYEQMQKRTEGAQRDKMTLEEQLEAKERECLEMKKLVEDLRKEHRVLFQQFKENQDKLLTLGGGGKVQVYMKDGATFDAKDLDLDLEKVKARPLFKAANGLYTELSGCLQTGMNELRSRVAEVHNEVSEREERMEQLAESAVRDKSVEAIQQLRSQVMLLKKKADEGESYRKELAAENKLLGDESVKGQAELKKVGNALKKKTVETDEEIGSLRGELVKLRKANWEQTSSLRTKYDGAMREAEVSADSQVQALTDEVARLERLLSETEAKLGIKNLAFGAERVVVEPSEVGLEREQRIVKLQSLVDKAAAEAEQSAKALREMEVQLGDTQQKHDGQVSTLREQFSKYRDAQERLVNGLNAQIRNLKESKGAWVGGGAGAGGRGGRAPFSRSAARARRDRGGEAGAADAGAAGRDADELLTLLAQRESQINNLESRLKRLAYEYTLKVEESEAARKSAYDLAAGTGGMDSMEQVGVSLVDKAILEAKIGVGEVEIKSLMTDLKEEKEVAANLRRELAASVLQTATVRREANKPHVQSVLKQLADYKRKAKMEMSNLQTQLAKAKEVKESKGGGEDGSKGKLKATQAALANMKDELLRKNKIVMNLRSSRSADEQAVAQWKKEVVDLEAKLVKANREMVRKEALLKDLRLRTLSLERTRMRQQITILKNKVTSQAEEIEGLQSDADHVKGLEGKINLLKASIVWKDSLLKAMKSQLEAAEKEFTLFKDQSESALANAQKTSRNLKSKVEVAEKLGGVREDEEKERISKLEQKKEELAHDLGNIKSSMYQIMGDLYTANAKARGSPAAAEKNLGVAEIEKLDDEKMAQISTLLDLSTAEMQEIFETGSNEISASRSSSPTGKGRYEEGENRAKYLSDLEKALDLSGESAVDVEGVMVLGRSLLDSISKAREGLE
ncbi:hypothetical protein TL16_g09433 [Triparma laevis f. inornata]|uniref:Uncharacterized protein n=1 Tax=Triparma laevis f. inornata TaxID=1714386 RepID=A0A9W7EMU5_9STRA|nr:hypothetical protein TL16_g09433 [Triparma laevis f. inornata]